MDIFNKFKAATLAAVIAVSPISSGESKAGLVHFYEVDITKFEETIADFKNGKGDFPVSYGELKKRGTVEEVITETNGKRRIEFKLDGITRYIIQTPELTN